MRINKIIYKCAIILFINLCITKAYAVSKLKLAIIDLTSQSELSNESNLVRDMLEIMLFKHNTFQILERKNVDFIIKQKGLKKTNCSDLKCATEIGKELSADIVLVCNITKTSNYIINYKLVKTSNNSILTANNKIIQNKEQLEHAVTQIAKEIQNMHNDLINKYYLIENSHTILISLGGFIPHQFSVFYDTSTDDSLAISIGLFKNNQFINNLSLGLQYEYVSYTYEEVVTNQVNKEESTSHSMLVAIHYAFIFDINQTFSFKIYPSFACGILFNNLKSNIDTYSSFDEDYFEIHRTIIYKPGFMCSLLVNHKYEIFTGFEYATNFEQHGIDYEGYKFSIGILFHI